MDILDLMEKRTPYNQVRRIWRTLLLLCNASGTLTIDEIRDNLCNRGDIEPDDRGQTARNIHRDIAFLRDMGYKIDNVRGQGYLLHGKSEVLPVLFTKEQIQAICLGRELFTPFEGTHFGKAIDEAYGQISSIYRKSKNSPNENLQRLENAFIVKIGPHRQYEGKKEIVSAVLNAILERKKLRIKYQPAEGAEQIEIIVLPHKFIIYKGSFYLLTILPETNKNEFRLLLVDRMISVQVLNETFEPSDTESFEARMEHSFGLLIEGPLTKVRILFDKSLTRYLQERIWHPSQKFKESKEGIWMEMDVLLNHEIVPWIVGFGKKVKKIEPKKLAEMVKAEK